MATTSHTHFVPSFHRLLHSSSGTPSSPEYHTEQSGCIFLWLNLVDVVVVVVWFMAVGLKTHENVIQINYPLFFYTVRFWAKDVYVVSEKNEVTYKGSISNLFAVKAAFCAKLSCSTNIIKKIIFVKNLLIDTHDTATNFEMRFSTRPMYHNLVLDI